MSKEDKKPRQGNHSGKTGNTKKPLWKGAISKAADVAKKIPVIPDISELAGHAIQLNRTAERLDEELSSTSRHFRQAEVALRTILPKKNVQQDKEQPPSKVKKEDSAPKISADSLFSLHQAGKRLEKLAKEGQQILQDTKQQVQFAGEEVTKRVPGLSQGIDVLQGVKRQAEERIQGAKKGVGEKVTKVRSTLQSGFEKLDKGVRQTMETGQTILRSVQRFADLRRHVEALKVGDCFSVGLGAKGSVDGSGVQGHGLIKVIRTDGPHRFVVQFGGELATGIASKWGASLAGKASLEARALLKGGGSIEVAFDSTNDVVKAIKVIAKHVLLAAANQKIPGVNPTPILEQFADKLLETNEDELTFLSEHLSSVECRGGIAVETAAGLGFQLSEFLKLAGAGVKGELEQDLGLRFSLPLRKTNGEVTRGGRITLFQELSGHISSHSGAGLGTSDKHFSAIGIGSQQEREVLLTLSNTFELPKDVTAESIRKEPLETIRSAAKRTRALDSSVQFQTTRRTKSSEKHESLQTFALLGVTPLELIESKAYLPLLQGKLKEAVNILGENVHAKWQTHQVNYTGLNLSPEISMLGFGVGIDAFYLKEDRSLVTHSLTDARKVWENANQAVSNLNPKLLYDKFRSSRTKNKK